MTSYSSLFHLLDLLTPDSRLKQGNESLTPSPTPLSHPPARLPTVVGGYLACVTHLPISYVIQQAS